MVVKKKYVKGQQIVVACSVFTLRFCLAGVIIQNLPTLVPRLFSLRHQALVRQDQQFCVPILAGRRHAWQLLLVLHPSAVFEVSGGLETAVKSGY